MDGTYAGADLVFFTMNGRVFARGRTEIANPKTAEQLLIRTFMTLASRNWEALTEVQRAAWHTYAETYFTTDEDGLAVTPSGIATYVRANCIRQMLGLAMTTDAPSSAPPSPITSIAQTAADPDHVSFTVTHGITTITGLQVVVRATPAMSSVARKPREGDYRLVCGANDDSAKVLPASGTVLDFAPSRYAVETGKRYGVEVRVVRSADGTMSPPVFGDFIKSVA